MVVEMKEKFEKTKNVKNNDESNNNFLRGERNVKFYDRIPSDQPETLKFEHNFIYFLNFLFFTRFYIFTYFYNSI